MPDDIYRIAYERQQQGVMRVHLTGEFDRDNADALAAGLAGALREPGVDHVVVDMRGTTFMDSSGITAVEEAYSVALNADKHFRLVNLQAGVQRVFEILELTELFEDQ